MEDPLYLQYVLFHSVRVKCWDLPTLHEIQRSINLIHIRQAAKPLRSPAVNRDIFYTAAQW